LFPKMGLVEIYWHGASNLWCWLLTISILPI